MSMLHHISFGVSNIERSASFYDAVLTPLGYASGKTSTPGPLTRPSAMVFPAAVTNSPSSFARKGQQPPGPGFHLAFAATSRRAVADFHTAALEKGGRDNGGPGFRQAYGPNYYAAFVIDPDGHPIEAVFNSPE